MNIDKAIRKQNKSLKRFLFSSCFVFLCILFILIFIPKLYKALKITLIFLEMIIIISATSKLEDIWLRYRVNYDKILIKTGIVDPTTVIRKSKVAMVHTKDINKEMKIIIIIASKVKKRTFKEVNKKFLKENTDIYKDFEKIGEKKPSEKYFYTIVDNGSFLKYKLLNDIYVNCEKAFFSDEAIENIKLYRNIE